MDTSKEYIKMCERAGEIQKLVPVNLQGHHYRWDNHIHILEGEYYYWKIEIHEIDKEKIWLPRQDQLQEMVGKYESCVISFFDYLKNNTGGWRDGSDGFADPDIYEKFTSMEQLWLAFVMKEKFNKTWNGKDWLV